MNSSSLASRWKRMGCGAWWAAMALFATLTVDGAAQGNIRAGFGVMAGANIQHPNGQFFDQVLLTGPNVTVAADPGQVVRVSFVDLNDDIVQVEFTGAGTVTVELERSSYRGPAAPAKYVQPGVNYVKGRAIVRVRGAGPDTYVSVFSVGRGNAVDQTLFPAGMTYDAMADIQLLDIQGPDIAAVLTGNVRYSASDGATGLSAPETRVRYRAIVGEIAASAEAVPLLRIGQGSSLEQDAGAILVAGGRLEQPNGSPIDVTSSAGVAWHRINAVAGTRSSGEFMPAGFIGAQFVSRSPGSVWVNGTPRTTRGYVPATFAELLAEGGVDAFYFGDGVTVNFSGGNTGSYTISINTVLEGEWVFAQLRGTYSYVVEGANQNRVTFSLSLGTLSLSSASVSFQGTIYQLAREAGEILPVRFTATAEFNSMVSGTATVSVLFTSGAQETETVTFDAENGLDFAFF